LQFHSERKKAIPIRVKNRMEKNRYLSKGVKGEVKKRGKTDLPTKIFKNHNRS